MAGMANWQAQISIDIDDLKKRIKVAEGELDKIEKKEHKVKLDIDTKTLENAVIKLDRMLESLGKGSGDFKEFENLSKQLSSITTDINNISKAFSVMNDGSDFANSIKSIDTSLTALSNHFVSEMSGRITSSIKEVKSTLSDVGDGGELAPLLQTINKIENAINELSTSVKGIGLNMNIDVGSDSEMEAKVQSKIANALQAYQRLFDAIKMSGAGGSVINTNFFEFDINQYDTMMGKLQAYKKFIDNMRKEAKTQYNGKDILYQSVDKTYWTQASAAMGQVTKAFNEMNAASDANPLKDLFGSGDLSEVISQLGLIVAKLEEISTTASSFKNVFDNGFNVTASVGEIDKLTNRIKELEDELSKIKLNPVNVDKSNISSENITSAIESQNKIQEELKETQKQAEQTADGIITVYRGLKSSSDEMFDSTHLSAWFSDNLKSANSFAKGIGDVYKSQIKLDNPMIVDAKGANHESILYAETNEELQKAIKLQEELNAKRKEFSEKYGKYLETQDMSLLGNPSEYLKDGDVIDELEQKLSRYLKTTEQLQEIAKNGGYDGLIIKNIKDNYLSSDDNIGTSYAVFDKEKIISYERINYLKELEKQAEQTTKAVQDVSETPIKDVFQGDKIDQATTSAKELDKILEQVDIPTDSFDDVLSKLDLTESKLKEIVKITKQSVSDSEGKFNDSYTLKDKRGSTEIYGLSSNTEKGQLLRSNIVEYDAKEIEKANKQILKSEQELQSQKDAFHKKNLTAIDLEIQKREEESKMFSSALKAQMEERQKDISSMESSLKSFNESSKQLSAKPDDQHQFSSWKKQLEDLNIEIAEYKSKVENLSKIDIADEAQINKAKTEIEELGKSIKETINTMSKTPQAKRGWTDIGASKAAEKVANVLKQNTKMSKEATDAIRAYYNELRSGNPSQPIDEILVKVNQLVQKERELGRVGKSFGEIFKEKVIYGGAAQLAGMVGFYDVINVIRQAGEAVIDLNTNITELAKVSEASVSQIYDDFNSYADIAKEVGGTISDTISATADWSRNGYNIPDSKELAEVAMIYKNVGDGIDIDQANEYLISTLRGFSLEAKDAMDIIDVFNEVSNNEAISSAGIGEALQRSAASFNAANTSLEKSVALITATRLQNWLNIWKHVLRIYLIAIEVFITMHHNIGETTI